RCRRHGTDQCRAGDQLVARIGDRRHVRRSRGRRGQAPGRLPALRDEGDHPVTTDLIGPWLDRWALTLDSEPWSTPSSLLALVRRMDGSAAVLKIPHLEEERLGCRVLAWWAGQGAAQVYEIDPSGTVLMERAASTDRLRTLAL